MFDSTALEVATGMALIYLLISLFCTAIREVIAGVLGSRAKNLETGIKSLFTEGMRSLATTSAGGTATPAVSLAEAVYNHGLIQSLYRSGSGTQSEADKRKLPSYIPTRAFATALLDILFPPSPGSQANLPATVADMLQRLETLPDSKAKEAISTLVVQANGDLDKLRKSFENWYDDGMDRAAGWYKRKTQLVLFIVGLTIAVVLNVDSIAVGRTLWVTPAFRSYTVAEAEAYAKTHPIASNPDLVIASADFKTLQSLSLPIGWGGANALWVRSASASDFWSGGLFALAGWLLTAIAVTLGAPFWFDVLNKFMVIRSTIKPGEKSGDEGSKDS